ncbi:MAG: electron transfer flavoprotein subunit beta/FixA family protein [Deltaproteobacteria bacterium]|nr:electron transfer flavoprotein subunit beta/FixA family protein [Deltaproteobacteria bacterium]
MAKILVPIKRVVDYETKVRIHADGNKISEDGVKWIVNPFDEIAVEEAIRLKEQKGDVEVVVASIGPDGTSEQLRTALAMGADRAIHVNTDAYIDSDAAHRILAEIYLRDSFQLVIMGKQAIDSDASQTGQLLAARLGLPQATFASKLVIDDSFATATVVREVDGGLETLRIKLPAVVTTDLRLNQPRYPSLPGIVKAKKKPLDVIELSGLGIDTAPKVRIVSMQPPAPRKAGVKVGSVAELLDKLSNEAKVI